MKKNIAYIALLPLLVFTIVGCGKFVEGYDESPNYPTNVNASQLLSAAELGLQVSYTSGVDRISSVLIQQIAGTKDQMLDVATYSLREGDNTNEWNTIYNNVIQTSNDLIVVAGDESPYYVGMAKVIKAMGLGLATDVWGDVPAREAGLGLSEGILTPKFETQEEVYGYIQELLEEALIHFDELEESNLFLPSTDDFFFEGKIDKWKNITNLLRARYANHLSKRDPEGSATNVLSYLTNVTDAGDLNAVYGSGGSELNQWYAFENSRADYIKMGANMIDMLNAKNDPRLPFYADSLENGTYVGSPVGEPDLTASVIGSYVIDPVAPIQIVTYTEALFLKAEASFRLGDKITAASSYNEAVKASIKKVTKEDAPAPYITAEASETDATITLKKIMEQKYLAMFINFEAWVDWRRTGFPVLTANPNGDVAGIPQRLPTPIDERKYNPNAVVVSDILKRVWWAE